MAQGLVQIEQIDTQILMKKQLYSNSARFLALIEIEELKKELIVNQDKVSKDIADQLIHKINTIIMQLQQNYIAVMHEFNKLEDQFLRQSICL